MKTQSLHFFTEDLEMAGIRLTFTTNATIKEELYRFSKAPKTTYQLDIRLLAGQIMKNFKKIIMHFCLP